MEADLLSSSAKVRSRSGVVQVWLSLQPKFNSFELDSEVGRLFYLEVRPKSKINPGGEAQMFSRNFVWLFRVFFMAVPSSLFLYCSVRRIGDNWFISPAQSHKKQLAKFTELLVWWRIRGEGSLSPLNCPDTVLTIWETSSSLISFSQSVLYLNVVLPPFASAIPQTKAASFGNKRTSRPTSESSS